MKRLYYGMKDGNIVSIANVCSGKDCGCTCPTCGEVLIAKKGNIKIHHFAHVSNKECEYGYETSLHLLAKDIIKDAKTFVLPKEEPDSYYYKLIKNTEHQYDSINNAIEIHIDKVEVEKAFDDIKPDLVLYSGEKKYFVEIFVTHKVDENKLAKIKNKKIDTIEICLKKNDDGREYDILKKILLGESANKYWIYNSKIERMKEKLIGDRSIKIIMYGSAWYTVFCPMRKRNFRGKSYANVNDDCCRCEYCLSVTHQTSLQEYGKVICLANKSRANNIIRIQKTNQLCPRCYHKLELHSGPSGSYYRCSNHYKCGYRRDIISRTSK